MALDARTLPIAEPLRTLPLAGGALLLGLVVADSTARAGWVTGAVALPSLCVLGALVGSAAGLSRLRGSTALTLAAAPAPVAAFIAVWAQQVQAGQPFGRSTVAQWGQELLNGQAANDSLILLLLLNALFWLLGAWLAWGVLRRRQALLAVAPAGAALATNVLNFPDGQDAFVFWFVVLTLGVLLWSTYHASLAGARQRRVELAENARWDFWERGALAAAALVALGVMTPPLSGSDRTLDVQNGLSDAWGRITHSSGAGVATSVGFSADARLGGTLIPGTAEVFDYTVAGQAPGPAYFRGLDLQPQFQEWSFVPRAAATQDIARGQEVPYAEGYQEQQRATYKLSVVRPPASAPDLIVAPGQLATVDRDVQVMQSRPRDSIGPFGLALSTVDQATAASGRGSYQVQVDQSIASEAELRADSTAYPGWIQVFRTLPPDYRPSVTEQKIRDLARRVTAGATNPYDEAVAIERYLRGSDFTYTLKPGPPPVGVDVEDWFLFNAHAGYCQYFATAMADMLRSLNVPVRLVNGYGPGTFDSSKNRWVVHESDAHTWPEAYFPSYGWIPFEPTADGVYQTIARGGSGGVSCTDTSCTNDPNAPSATPAPAPTPRVRPEPAVPAVGGGSSSIVLPALRTWTPIGALLLLVLVLLYIAAARFLRPQTVAGVWQRATLLLQLAGVHTRIGETPIEFGDRVAGVFPEAAAGIRQLAGDFAVAAYAPPWLAELCRPQVLADWTLLRPVLLRRVAARLRRRHA